MDDVSFGTGLIIIFTSLIITSIIFLIAERKYLQHLKDDQSNRRVAYLIFLSVGFSIAFFISGPLLKLSDPVVDIIQVVLSVILGVTIAFIRAAYREYRRNNPD